MSKRQSPSNSSSTSSPAAAFDREAFLDRVAEVHHTRKDSNCRSFVVRPVEEQFRTAVRRADQFIIALHGASKQGKSSIIRNTFTDPATFFFVPIGDSFTPESLYRSILGKAGARFPAGMNVEGNASLTIKLPIVELGAGGGGELQYETVTGDLSNADWIAHLLKRCSRARVIILDNFHYIDKDTQRSLARDFAVFGALGYKIVIAGTWPQVDYLNDLQTDLSGHYLSFSVDPWTKRDLESVVRKGAEELQTRLDEDTTKKLVNHARGSIFVMHRLMRKFYELADMNTVASGGPVRCPSNNAGWDNSIVQPVGHDLARDIKGKLREAVAFGDRDENGRTIASYILEAMLSSSFDKFESGFTVKELFEATTETMKRRGRSNLVDFSSFSSIAKSGWIEHQRKKLATPIIFFDDRKERVAIYDAHALFAIRMNAFTIRAELM